MNSDCVIDHDFALRSCPRDAVGPAGRCITAAVLLAVLLNSPGCGDAEGPAAKRVRVFGDVTLDGLPLRAGAIVFHCGEGENQVRAVGFIEHGAFDIAEQDGPLAGPARVEFHPKPLPPDQFEQALEQWARSRTPPQLDVVAIPRRYGAESQWTVNIAAETDNELDFPLVSR